MLHSKLSKSLMLFVWMSSLLMTALSPGATKAGELRVTTTTLPGIFLFDANPQYTGPDLALSIEEREPRLSAATRSSMEEYLARSPQASSAMRVGASTDGVSQLLVRATVPAPGDVRCLILDEDGQKAVGDSGTCEILFPGEEMVGVDGGNTWGYVFALYTPPEHFDAGPKLKHQGKGERTATLAVSWRDPNMKTTPEYQTRIPLKMRRPPVVLVHGTYDNPTDAWDYPESNTNEYWRISPATYQTTPLAKQLTEQGYNVYQVDYEHSNGSSGTFKRNGKEIDHARSYFYDNQWVLYNGETHLSRLEGKGISDALTDYRNDGVAATQVDAVGHSMGGVLIRAYARGSVLPAGERAWRGVPNYDCGPPPAKPDQVFNLRTNWYYRDNNFRKGDLNRIITIGSTHKGSHISRYLQHFAETSQANFDRENDSNSGQDRFVASLDLGVFSDWAGYLIWWGADEAENKFDRGAFTDQIPMSPALKCLGPTPVPAHAIGTVATIADLDLFKDEKTKIGTYRGRMTKIWENSVSFQYLSFRMLEEIFRNRLNQRSDSFELNAILLRDLELPQTPEEASTRQSLREELAKRRFAAAVFGNDYTDFTVSLDSQLGGIKNNKYRTILPAEYKTLKSTDFGILHGYQPRHRLVQEQVIKLLNGGMDNFRPEGFPESETPAYFPPAKARFAPVRYDYLGILVDGELFLRWRNP